MGDGNATQNMVSINQSTSARTGSKAILAAEVKRREEKQHDSKTNTRHGEYVMNRIVNHAIEDDVAK